MHLPPLALPGALALHQDLASQQIGAQVFGRHEAQNAGVLKALYPSVFGASTPIANAFAQGRLTLTSGSPVTTADVSGATTVYFSPFRGNLITLWDGSAWQAIAFSEVALALGTMTAGLNYDVFGYLSAGSLALEKLAWSSNTARATAVTLQDGRYCKSGDKTRLYLGTLRSTSTTATEDSGGGVTSQVGGKRFVWNNYNRVARPLSVIDTTGSWVYTTDTVRQANGAVGNKVELVIGIAEDAVSADVRGVCYLQSNSARTAKVGIGIDSTSAFSGIVAGAFINLTTAGGYGQPNGRFAGILSAGYHFLSWCEKGADNTCTFVGNSGGDGQQTGLVALILA